MRPYVSLAVIAFFLVACNSAANSEAPESSDAQTTETQTQADDQHMTAQAVDAYMLLKNALIASDADGSVNAAMELKSELSGLPEDDTLLTVMIMASDSLAHSEDLSVQRSAFEIISDNFYIYLKENGNGRPLYRQYCPMAFNNRGAYWISDEKQVMNPYFGDAMLKCGAVREEF